MENDMRLKPTQHPEIWRSSCGRNIKIKNGEIAREANSFPYKVLRNAAGKEIRFGPPEEVIFKLKK